MGLRILLVSFCEFSLSSELEYRIICFCSQLFKRSFVGQKGGNRLGLSAIGQYMLAVTFTKKRDSFFATRIDGTCWVLIWLIVTRWNSG